MPKSYSIVGDQHQKSTDFLKELADGTAARLVREPRNEYDPNAVAVYIGDRKVGFIPKKQNAALAAYIDQAGDMAMDSADPAAGRQITAVFFHSPNSRFPMVDVSE